MGTDKLYNFLSSRVQCITYQSQGSRVLCSAANPKEELWTLLVLCILKYESLSLTTLSSIGWNNTFLTQRKDRERSASGVCVGPPWPVSLTSTPLVLQWKEPCPQPTVTYNNRVGQVPGGTQTLNRDKRVLIAPETKESFW